MEELDNANSIHAFNRFEEKGYLERFQCHFRLVNIPCDALYAWPRLPSRNKVFYKKIYNFNGIIKRVMSTSLM